MKRPRLAFLISIGKWGGIYWDMGSWTARLCLGWIAFTILRIDGDVLLALALEQMAARQAAAKESE